jgi:glycosyltransferase involved in cell wall biosynthesis
MRVLHVWRDGADGGAQRAIREIARATERAGCSSVVAASSGSFEFGVERVVIPPYNRSRTGLLTLGYALKRAVRAVRPDLIHCHSIGMGFLLEAVAWRAPPLILGLHGLPSRSYDRRLGWPLRFGRATVVAYGPGTSGALTNLGVPHRLLHHGIAPPPPPVSRCDLASELGFDHQSRILVCVGRLSHEKNQQLLVRALAHLPADTTGLLVGDGPDRGELELLAADLGVAHRVAFTGWRDDARAVLGAANVAVMPSRWEGFGLAALEAMRAGIPLVTSDAPGLRDWVEDDVTALVVPVDDAAATAAAIARLLQDEALSARLSRNATEFAAQFSIEAMCAEHITLYRDILSHCSG